MMNFATAGFRSVNDAVLVDLGYCSFSCRADMALARVGEDDFSKEVRMFLYFIINTQEKISF
jgi:hypothetical protein